MPELTCGPCPQPPEVRYPKEQGHDAVPMIKHLKYKDQFRPVMQQVSRSGQCMHSISQ